MRDIASWLPLAAGGGEFTQHTLQLLAEYTEAKMDVTQEIEQRAQQRRVSHSRATGRNTP